MRVWWNDQSMRLILTRDGSLMREGYDQRFHSVVAPMYGVGCTMEVAEEYARVWGYVDEKVTA